MQKTLENLQTAPEKHETGTQTVGEDKENNKIRNSNPNQYKDNTKKRTPEQKDEA